MLCSGAALTPYLTLTTNCPGQPGPDLPGLHSNVLWTERRLA